MLWLCVVVLFSCASASDVTATDSPDVEERLRQELRKTAQDVLGMTDAQAAQFYSILQNDTLKVSDQDKMMEEFIATLPEDVQAKVEQMEAGYEQKSDELQKMVDEKLKSLSPEAQAVAKQIDSVYERKDMSGVEMNDEAEKLLNTLSPDDADELENLLEEVMVQEIAAMPIHPYHSIGNVTESRRRRSVHYSLSRAKREIHSSPNVSSTAEPEVEPLEEAIAIAERRRRNIYGVMTQTDESANATSTDSSESDESKESAESAESEKRQSRESKEATSPTILDVNATTVDPIDAPSILNETERETHMRNDEMAVIV